MLTAESARTHLSRTRRITGADPTHRMVAVTSRAWSTNAIEAYASVADLLGRQGKSGPAGTSEAVRQRISTIRLALLASPDQLFGQIK